MVCETGSPTFKHSERMIRWGHSPGTWNGEIEVPGQPLKIKLTFTDDSGSTEGSISIPVQSVEDFSLSTIKLADNQVSFEMPLPGQKVNFTGTVKSDKIEGTFTQNGQSMPFHVKNWVDTVQQEKTEDEDFMEIETNTGKLYSSIVTPETGEKFPVALIILGSGPTDRNGNSPGIPGKNNSLKMLAEGLAEKGIASLRYDKRGAGKNLEAVISEEEMRFDQFVTDANQWIAELQKDERFTDIIVIGHSQGSLVGIIAAQDSAADAFISIAGAGRSIDQVLSEQLKTLPESLYKESEQILVQLSQGKTVDNISDQLMSVFRPSVQPFLISWMDYNPAEEIKQLTIPALIINGENDLQLSVRDAEMLAEAKPDAKLLLIDKMNHILKKAPADKDGNMATYSDPTLPLADGLVQGIIKFLDTTNRISR